MLEKFEEMVFDQNCFGWEANQTYNELFIRHAERHLNDKLQAIGWLSLNEIYDSLGKGRVLEAQVIGWKISDEWSESNCIKFELEKNDNNSDIRIRFKNMVKLL